MSRIVGRLTQPFREDLRASMFDRAWQMYAAGEDGGCFIGNYVRSAFYGGQFRIGFRRYWLSEPDGLLIVRSGP